MQWLMLVVLAGASLGVYAQEALSIEVGGLVIKRGMSEHELRSAIKPPYGMYCVEKPAGELDDFCVVQVEGEWEDGAEIWFQHGVVHSASRNLRSSSSREAYELMQILNELLARWTDGADTCAMVSTYSQDPPAPKSLTTMLVLPEKYVTMTTTTRGDQVGVSIEERLRVNPVPGSHRVRKSRGEAGQCVLVE